MEHCHSRFRARSRRFAQAAGLLMACAASLAHAAEAQPLDLRDTRVGSPTAYISAQCYTRTEDAAGQVFNPCYTCHRTGQAPTYLDDHDLQLSYALPSEALSNPWTNLFVDRRTAAAAISDEAILEYVRTDNYRDPSGEILLAATLVEALPSEWDLDADGRWGGYVPDAYFELDQQGFDHHPDGRYTGWRAFGYYPFPGTFWPTNGSTDDVMIRLAPAFRENSRGEQDITVYRINLAIVEAAIKRESVRIDPVDERGLGVDLDRDGRLAQADTVAFDWAPLEGRFMRYVGRAGSLQAQGQLHLAAGLFPEGTELLHSVRYIDLSETGDAVIAPRMKELRYARKAAWYNYAELKGINDREGAERALDPDILKSVSGDYETGMFTQGWLYQGFIEDADGALRPQSQEETLFCMGCHGGIGATTDTVFSFPRKLGHSSYRNGWFHWTQRGLRGLPEPRAADGTYEYSRYLALNGAGDELRSNHEVSARFFDDGGRLREEELEALHDDIGRLLLPSAERALQLNKAYRLIVQEQSFVRGRDATLSAPQHVHRALTQGQPTGVEQPVLR